jgi:hypothetical protein
LADAISLRFKDEPGPSPVALAAPTGKAAVHIQGSTLHSLLKIEVQQGTIGLYHALKPKFLSDLKSAFENVRLVVIDEYSMVSNVLLMKVHLRLCEISGIYDRRK